MRLTLVIFSLRGGGAERVITLMANHWAAKGWRITLLTYDDGSEDPAYHVDAAVIRKPLGIEGRSPDLIRALVSNVWRLFVIRDAIRDSEPDMVISFLDRVNVRTLIACCGLSVPVIVSERVDPAHHGIGLAWSVLRRISYRRASCVVAQTERALSYFSRAIQRRGYVVPNSAPGFVRDNRFESGGRGTVAVAMGRLTRQKGFDQLLRAFSIIAGRHRSWSLVIWGEGPARGELETLRDQLSLQERVFLPGWTSDPFGEMRRGSLFVLSSRYEGFAMVLLEAMACGLPVVSFDCPSGAREIVRHGVDGILVPPADVCALAEAMDRLLGDDAERNRLAARAVEVSARFGEDSVMEMWEAVLHDAAR